MMKYGITFGVIQTTYILIIGITAVIIANKNEQKEKVAETVLSYKFHICVTSLFYITIIIAVLILGGIRNAFDFACVIGVMPLVELNYYFRFLADYGIESAVSIGQFIMLLFIIQDYIKIKKAQKSARQEIFYEKEEKK